MESIRARWVFSWNKEEDEGFPLAYRPFIGMDVPGEDEIGPSRIEQRLHGGSHVVPFALVSPVAVVPGDMEEHQEPWRFRPVNLREVSLDTDQERSQTPLPPNRACKMGHDLILQRMGLMNKTCFHFHFQHKKTKKKTKKRSIS